jgi:hypothetical protein
MNIKNNQITELEKCLIVLMKNGIYIQHADGHRWIHCGNSIDSEEYDRGEYSYDAELKKYGIQVNSKIYGGVCEAVVVVNETWKMMYNRTLIQEFDNWFDVEWDVAGVDNWQSRIDRYEKGTGGLG